jgi:hypothetical protein
MPLRVPSDLGSKVHDVEEHVGLTAQLGGYHRRLSGYGGDHCDLDAVTLHGPDQCAEIAVAREEHHMIDMLGELHGIDGEFDVHVAFDLATAGLVNKFLVRLISRAPRRASTLLTALETVAFERLSSVAARANECVSATFAKIASPSRSGSFGM